MRQRPGSVKKRDLERALREYGFEVKRSGAKHEVWSNGGVTLMVPRTLKGAGTIRHLVEQIIASRSEP